MYLSGLQGQLVQLIRALRNDVDETVVCTVVSRKDADWEISFQVI